MNPNSDSLYIKQLQDRIALLGNEHDRARWDRDYDRAEYLAYMLHQFEAELGRALQSRSMVVNQQLSNMERGYLAGMQTPDWAAEFNNYTPVTVVSNGETWEEVPREDLAPDSAIELQDIMI